MCQEYRYVRQSDLGARFLIAQHVACAQSALVRGRNSFRVRDDNVCLDLSTIFAHAIDRSNSTIDRNDWRVAMCTFTDGTIVSIVLCVESLPFEGRTKTKIIARIILSEVSDESSALIKSDCLLDIALSISQEMKKESIILQTILFWKNIERWIK